jgi:hypothetical protein
MASAHPRPRATTLGVAAAGVALGHWLTYAIDVPDANAREAVLARTGHGYLPLATELAVVTGIAALAIVFLGRLMRRDRDGSGVATFGRLVAFQAGAFVAMEFLERIAAGASVGHLFHGAILPIGLLLQIAMAGIGALLLRMLLRAADTIAGSSSRAVVCRRSVTLPVGWFAEVRPGPARAGAHGIRGPPLPQAS